MRVRTRLDTIALVGKEGHRLSAEPSTKKYKVECRVAHGELNVDQLEFLKRVYEGFNARNMESILAAMHHDVVWANGMEGGHVHGRDEVRKYWTRQWAMIDPSVQPVEFLSGADGEIVVEVHQVVRDLNGNFLADKMVGHLFRIENGLIKRFDIRGD